MTAAPIPSFVIHLGRASARAGNVERIRAALPWPVDVFPATDGRAMSDEELAVWCAPAPRFAPAYPFALGPAEIGCFLSHRRVWERMAQDRLPYALVMEDDVEIDTDVFLPALELARRHVGALGYVQFQTRALRDPGEVVAQEGGVQLRRLSPSPLRAAAQLISLAAVERFLPMTRDFDRPVDTFVQMHWETGVHPVCATPSGVRDLTQESGGSTIQIKKQPVGRKLRREWLRFRYRRAVSRLARVSQ